MHLYFLVTICSFYAACLQPNAGIWNPWLKLRHGLKINLSWAVATQFLKVWLLACSMAWAAQVTGQQWLEEQQSSCQEGRAHPVLRAVGWHLGRSERPLNLVISLWGCEQASSRALVFCRMGPEIEICLMRETCHLFGNLASRFTSWKLSVEGFVWEDEKVYVFLGGQVGMVALPKFVQLSWRDWGHSLGKDTVAVSSVLSWTLNSTLRLIGQWVVGTW